MASTVAPPHEAPSRPTRSTRTARRRAILDLVAARAIGSQEELASLLRARGFAVTQATVSRDIAELGLVKAARGDRHAYLTQRALTADPGPRESLGSPADVSPPRFEPNEARLLRILADYPLTIARSGLILVIVSRPGSASAIGQALDESPLDDEVGTLAGDNTLLVLFADAPALERWQARFTAIAAQAAAGLPGADLTSTYP